MDKISKWSELDKILAIGAHVKNNKLSKISTQFDNQFLSNGNFKIYPL